MISLIISGGQTGVDQAAIDTAIKLDIAYSGMCPKGRLSEDGTIPEHYVLVETESSDYSVRTIKNIELSDGTIVIVPRLPLGVEDGTKLTVETLKSREAPLFIIDATKGLDEGALESAAKWIADNKIGVLNIAGPRESSSPGIYDATRRLLGRLFSYFLDRGMLISSSPSKELFVGAFLRSVSEHSESVANYKGCTLRK